MAKNPSFAGMTILSTAGGGGPPRGPGVDVLQIGSSGLKLSPVSCLLSPVSSFPILPLRPLRRGTRSTITQLGLICRQQNFFKLINCIIPAIALSAHAANHTIGLQKLLIIITGVLAKVLL